MANPYCTTELGDHEQVNCDDFPLGGISEVLLLEPDHTITDFTDPVQVQAAIDANLAYLVTGISGEIPEPSPVEIDNPVACQNDSIVVNNERQVMWGDSNVTPSNIDFYNGFNGKKMGVVLYECEEDRITVIDELISWNFGRIIPKSNGEVQVLNIVGDYRRLLEPPIFDAPAGIFNQ